MKPRKPEVRSQSTVIQEEVRLNRYLSQAGVASRRKADELIEAGQVTVNGQVVTELGIRVKPGDRVQVGGRSVTPLDHEYILLNKPADTITTTSDDRGRRTVLDLIDARPNDGTALYPVGRLDRHTTGALLITNDGELAHRLMHPSYQIEKLYRIETLNSVKPHELELLRAGVDLEDGRAAADQVAYIDPKNHHFIGMSIHEGRNRQVRRMMEAIGHEVVALERVSYAGLTTDGVRKGKWRRLNEREVQRLKRLVKL
jgi:23S rRNA pseudouridine2605 synthase